MAKTHSDFSQLSRGMFRKSDPVVEVKPLPKTRALDDEALAYFGLTGRGGLEDGTGGLRGAGLPGAFADRPGDADAACAALKARLEAAEAKVSAVDAERGAAERNAGELERRRGELRQIIKDTGSFVDARAMSRLERLGFRCVSGNKHWKLDYADVRHV